jgi:hypothetical protein
MTMAARKSSLSDHFEKLKKASDFYAEEASALSEGIVEIQMKLNSLEGKIATGIPIESGTHLAFNRLAGGDRWSLFWVYPGNTPDKELVSCTVEQKIKAAAFIPALVEKMAAAQLERVNQLRAARTELDLFRGGGIVTSADVEELEAMMAKSQSTELSVKTKKGGA